MRKYNLLFDGTILTNEFDKNNARSGIFFATKNIFKQLLQYQDIDIALYCDLRKYNSLKKYLRKNNLQTLEVINAVDYGLFEKLKYHFAELKNSCSKKKHPFLRAFANLLLAFSSLLLILKNKICRKKKYERKLKKFDFYFSPCHAVPKLIKKQKEIISSVFLYDTIPLIYPQNFSRKSSFWFTKLMKNFSDKEIYFTDSQSAKNDFLKFVPMLNRNQIKVAYLAASNDFKVLKNAEIMTTLKEKYNIPDGNYFLCLSTLEPRKNLAFTIKCFIEFIKKNNINDLYLVIGGAAWDKFLPRLQDNLADLKEYESKILLIGYVDDKDLPYLYSNALCFSFISKYEGFGIPVLEAMQSGVPVVTSNVSSLPEVVGDAGIQINPYSQEECIKAYEEIYFNESTRQYYINKGLERAKTFSWKKCADVITDELKRRKDND